MYVCTRIIFLFLFIDVNINMPYFLKVEYLIQHEMLLLLVEEMVTLAYRY